MIQWLIQTRDAHPDLLQGMPPPGLLSAKETAVFNDLKIAKRRQDWLLGRWTVKQLLQQLLLHENGQIFPFESMSIIAGGEGAPEVHFDPQIVKQKIQFTISISHAQHTAFCAALNRNNWPLGADIEWIEPRSPRFVEGYFTEYEQTFLRQVPPELQDTQITAFWSAKEAALKAIRQGLRLDTRDVECHFEIVDKRPEDWIPFRIVWRRLTDSPFPQLQGWWKATADYVLTLAVEEGQENDYVA